MFFYMSKFVKSIFNHKMHDKCKIKTHRFNINYELERY